MVLRFIRNLFLTNELFDQIVIIINHYYFGACFKFDFFVKIKEKWFAKKEDQFSFLFTFSRLVGFSGLISALII